MCTCITSGWREFAREHEFGVDRHPTDFVERPATFMGIRRDDGRVATRNFIGVLTSVNCSATVARAIADHFRRDVHPEALADYPNVDGVIALTHGLGCGIDMQGEGLAILRRTLAGYAVHPNFYSRAVRRARLRDEPDFRRARIERIERRRAPEELHDPGQRRVEENGRAWHRDGEGNARRREPRLARAVAARRISWSGCNAAARTVIRAFPRTPRSAPPSTGSCGMAARRFSPKRPRSTAPSTCSRAAR